MNNEYYTTVDIARLTGLNTRQILYIISQIDTTESLLNKDKSGQYRIHRLLLPKFKKKENKRIKYYAYSTDLPRGYTENQIIELVKYATTLCKDFTKIELSIEQKNKNHELHIHSILSTKNKTEFIKKMRFVFDSKSYKCTPLFDRKYWLSYITKYGTEITTITNKKTD